MLVDWLLDLLIAARDKFFALLDSMVPDPPDWVAQGPFYISDVVARAAALDAWVPISLAAPVIAFIPVAILAGVAIKVARIALSFASLGGGSAG